MFSWARYWPCATGFEPEALNEKEKKEITKKFRSLLPAIAVLTRGCYKFLDKKLKGILFVVVIIIVVDWLINFDKLHKMVIFPKTRTQKNNFFRS